ncbi:unnamed protein product, partial [Brachionus calyciflorus]
WKYHTGNSWGVNPKTGKSCLGCGAQEEFYGCSDISVGTSQIYPNTNDSFIFKPPVYEPQKTTHKMPHYHFPTTTYFKQIQTPTTTPFLYETTSNVTFKCPNNGLYANYAKGCREFYSCVHVGTRWENVVSMSCPASLLFDNRVKSCNYANLVNCYANSYLDFMDNIDNYRNMLADFIQEFKMVLKQKNKILSLTIPSAQNLPKNRVKASQVINNIDYINLIGYDIHGPWESDIRHHSPLLGNMKHDVHSLVKGMLNYGVPSSKLVLGVALYGRTFRKKYYPTIKGQIVSIESGLSGKYTKSNGMIAYFEICELMREYGWSRIWDNVKRVPVLHNGNEWIGYEDSQSLVQKARYAKIKNLAGVMFWDVSLDDYTGNFCKKGKFYLINKVKKELFSNNQSNNLMQIKKSMINYSQKTNGHNECWRGDGYYPDFTSNCSRYYLCSNSQTSSKQIQFFYCAYNTFYSDKEKACLFKWQMECKRY